MSALTLIISFLTFVQLNCENLFDYKDDPQTEDSEYLPESPRRWTRGRYWQKLKNISREIVSCGEDSTGTSLPHLIALCEVENDSVLHDLTKRTMLYNIGYKYLTTHSADRRGIDVALIYDPNAFKPLAQHDIKVDMPENEHTTRDILYVPGLIITDDTLHVFVIHSPSRYGGKRSTNHRRMAVAKALSATTDSIKRVSQNAKIIISGDFNDEAEDPALQYLYANDFINTTHHTKGENGALGTYKYQGLWQSIDHILVSQALEEFVTSTSIHDASFLLTEDDVYGGVKPRRTYLGYKYNRDGYSDHLPLVMRLRIPSSTTIHKR